MVSPNAPEDNIRRLSANDLYWEEVKRAREQPIGDKIFAGLDLFELACEFTLAGIRSQHPEADEGRVFDILRQRLLLARRLEDGA